MFKNFFVLSVVIAMLASCATDPNTPEHWEKAFKSAKTHTDRVRIVQDMRDQKRLSGPFVAVLLKQLDADKRADVKAAIARALADAKDPSSVDGLIQAVIVSSNDSDERNMNKEIVGALRAIGSKKAAPTLIQLIKTRDDFTVVAAIETLGELQASEAIDPLIDLANSDSISKFIVKKSAMALGDLKAAKAVPVLIKLMFKEREGASFYGESSFSLYQVGQPAADALIPVLTGEDKELAAWANESKILPAALLAKAAQVLGDLHEKRAEKALIQGLSFNSPAEDIKLFVRMRMADALGRMKSTAAVKPLAGMLAEPEANARQEYIRALIKIGGRDAVPALTQSAMKGSWDARETAMRGLAMLGDEKEGALFEKFLKTEEAMTSAECKADSDYKGCNDVPGLVKNHLEIITKYSQRLAAAKECKSDAACWSKKLSDADPGIAERAAFELGRNPQVDVTALLAKLTEPNLDTRLAVIQAVDWIIDDNPAQAKVAKAAAPKLQQQLAQEKGKTEFLKVNEDLRRLYVKMSR